MKSMTKLALAATTALTLATAAAANTDSTLRNGFVLDENMSVVDNAMKVRNLTTLVDAVVAAGLAPMLSGEGPYTVFAPINSAFNELGADAVNDLLKPENKAQLIELLQLHVVAGDISSADIERMFDFDEENNDELVGVDNNLFEVKDDAGRTTVRLRTVGNKFIQLTESAGDIYIDKNASDAAEVIVADIATSNGTLHIIDGVIIE